VRRLVVFSRDELKQSVMAQQYPDPRMRWMIGDVCDGARVRHAMSGVDLLVHAAAMKQIPTCEDHPRECKRINIDGTDTVAMAAIDAGVERAVFLSTDKAAEPNTHYGACKLAAERLWTRANVYAAGTRTRLLATRYGNVLGSRGSVVEVWRQQAERDGRITITDAGMTRFWMTIEDAVDLVLTAFRHGRGGEVFVPLVGASDIATLAEAVVPSVPTVEIGLRYGEKRHEVLISANETEGGRVWFGGDHYRIEPVRTWEYLPEPEGEPVESGWSYRSDTCTHRLTAETLRGMIA
jgi:UDP-N-acetylglucosamine 4,6-dehydratase